MLIALKLENRGGYMEDKKEYVLCGGTFFTLLLRARKQRIAARRIAEGESD